MRRRFVAVLGGLMMTADALAVVAPVSMGVAPASAASGDVRPIPIRSVT
ncbi:hypothetical protein [Actinomadura harenae]|nr:hypothetical protein [Actinomadura harenae]